MKLDWIIRGLVMGAIFVQGLVGTSPAPAIALGSVVVIPEGGAVRVASEGLRMTVDAVGFMWYVDGESDVFAEITVTHRGKPYDLTLTLGKPYIVDNLKIEMLAGDFSQDCTVRVTRIDSSL